MRWMDIVDAQVHPRPGPQGTPDKYTVVLKSEQSRPSKFDFFQQFNMGDRQHLHSYLCG
jgi:hypothetical protein